MTALTSLIVGPGAIGSIVCLHAQRYSSVFVHKHRDDLTLASSLQSSGQRQTLMWQPYGDNLEIDDFKIENREVNIIWVCCKANHVMSAIPSLAKQHPNATIVLLHNGMGPQQQLSDQFPGRCLWGFTTCGAIKLDNGDFQQTSYGTTPIALPISDSVNLISLSKHLSDNTINDPLSVEFVDNIEDQLWFKIIINAVINYITAYYQIPNGALLDPKYSPEIKKISAEANNVRSAAGFKPIDNITYIIRDIAQNSVTNRSSMAEDIRCSRTTENEFIIGYLLASAAKSKTEAPTLKVWYERIAELEKT